MKTRTWFAFAALLITAAAFSPRAISQVGDAPIVQEPVLAQRDFPFLMRLLQTAPARQALAQDPNLQRITRARWAAVEAAAVNCNAQTTCEGKALLFTPQQVDGISSVLRHIYKSNATVRAFTRQLTPHLEFALNPSLQGEDLFVDNWVRSAAGINLIIQRYCESQPPHYDVDISLYPEDSRRYGRLVQILLEDLHVSISGEPQARGHQSLFFEPSLRFSIRLLESNSLDQPGRFWPLRTGPNAVAVQHLKAIQWNKYPYSVILVPGAGSQLPSVPLSPWGKERLRLAAAAYHAGMAPLLIVSGGFVHPPHTHFCEAIEMKRYLRQSLGIPASAILVEPYARHTTTNLRNAAREILEDGMPAQRPMLIVSDADQIGYIQSDMFAARCKQELGYLPVKLGKQISPTQLVAILSPKSRFRDPRDPLDP
jgi:hypothetical protein